MSSTFNEDKQMRSTIVINQEEGTHCALQLRIFSSRLPTSQGMLVPSPHLYHIKYVVVVVFF